MLQAAPCGWTPAKACSPNDGSVAFIGSYEAILTEFIAGLRAMVGQTDALGQRSVDFDVAPCSHSIPFACNELQNQNLNNEL